MKNVRKNDIDFYFVLTEQHEIVRRVGLLFERADAIEHEVAAAGRRCERLTQAVLGKAFRGEVVMEMLEIKPSGSSKAL
jgi:type I restriction enzyme, S subunit